MPPPRPSCFRPAAPLRAALLWALLAAPPAGAQEPAAEPVPAPRPQVVTVAISGPIGKRHIEQFRAALANVTGEPLPAGLIVLLDSGGGDGLAAMELGRLARTNNAHVFVRNRCASACIFVLSGGVYRDAAPDTIGIHRGRLTRYIQGKGVVNADTEADTYLKDLLAVAETEAREYLAQMGMPPQLFESMQKVPSSRMRMLSREEAAELGLIGYDPAYLDRRAATLASRHAISREQLLRRSSLLISKCESQIRAQQDFIACYRRGLLAE